MVVLVVVLVVVIVLVVVVVLVVVFVVVVVVAAAYTERAQLPPAKSFEPVALKLHEDEEIKLYLSVFPQ